MSVTVVETQVDEIDNEFLDAVTEIEGKKSFPCDKYDKVCKSKGGQENLAESSEESFKVLLDEDTACSFVKAIKARIIEQDLYGTETNKVLGAVSSTKSLFTAVLPIYETFIMQETKPGHNAGIVLWSDTSIV